MKIKTSKHRIFPPNNSRTWVYYQEWNDALFLHYQVPKEVLEPYIPKGLVLDSYNGSHWVSLVAFTMNNVSPRYLPAVPFISNFNEINLRTYIGGDKPGVYFLSIEGAKSISNFIARHLSGLPYEKANIIKERGKYLSSNLNTGSYLKADFKIGESIIKDSLDIWLTERYCLYLDKSNTLYCYEIDHEEWEIKEALITSLDISYKFGGYALPNTPNKVHYSKGVKVLAWSREKL